ncbi:MAG: YebC/PmpR family DNA-binding regulatory protein [Cryomorphaceae bacterium]|nr:MAG: YebC/PmpR family DNA-binding regulatory protein [Cryomorphaceae bacterium]
MGRAFEFRKARKLKRWATMAKTFTRISKDIAMAVKDGGPNIDSNFRLRSIIQNAKSANMPKDNIERAIKNASNKNFDNYKEVILEGYSSGGIAIILDCISDNNNRTVGNIRSYFNKTDGNLATNGSVEFLFKKVCFFKITADENEEELELELIDFGLIEMEADNNSDFLIIYGEFDSYGKLYQELEKREIEVVESDFERIPVNYKSINEHQLKIFNKFIEVCNQDEDIQKISHNLQL